MKWHNAEMYLLNPIHFYLYLCLYATGLESVGHMMWMLLTKKSYILHINIHIE